MQKCSQWSGTGTGTRTHCFRPQRSCEKVMFSQVCVKNSVLRGRVYPSMHWGRHPPAQCMLGYTHPQADTPPRQTATAADSTHPTGMHSCFLLCQSSSICRFQSHSHVMAYTHFTGLGTGMGSGPGPRTGKWVCKPLVLVLFSVTVPV